MAADYLKDLKMAGEGGLSAASALNPYAAAANAIPQLFQAGLGIAEQVKGDRLAHSAVRPFMSMPAAQVESLYNARNMAGGIAPGLDLARQQLAQNHAGTVYGIRSEGGSGAERMQALLGADQNAGMQALQMGQQQEDWASRMQMNLQNQLAQAAETQQRQFIYNKDEPYRNIMEASKANRDSSNQNIHGALTGLGGTFASALTGEDGSGSSATPDASSFDPNTLAFDPNKGADATYDFNSLTDAQKAPPAPKGPYPDGYDPKTGKMTGMGPATSAFDTVMKLVRGY